MDRAETTTRYGAVTHPGVVSSAAAPADEVTVATLQLIADATALLSGFESAAIHLVRPDGRLETVATVGGATAGDTAPVGSAGLAAVPELVEGAEPWGRFRFRPAEDAPDDGRWHDGDLLFAPLVDGSGDLHGLFWLDRPQDGRRPDPALRERLDLCVEQASSAIVTARERERVAEQVRHAEAARALVRRATHHVAGDQPVESILTELGRALVEHFGLGALWIQLFGENGEAPILAHAAAPLAGRPPITFDDRFAPYAPAIASRLWTEQVIGVFGRTERHHVDESNTEPVALAEQYLDDECLESMLYAPLGAAADCLGHITMVRTLGAPRWTSLEIEAVREIGRDLGAILDNARADQRDRALLVDLRALDAYKSDMVATVSHELKNPLTAILANLELAETVAGDDVEYVVAAVDRSVQRMARIVADLRTLGEMGAADDPADVVPVDLAAIARDVVDLVGDAAGRRGLTLALHAPVGPVLVEGYAAELDRVVMNLVNNAIKYSPDGGRIRVGVQPAPDSVVLTVADQGIGIGEEDQERIFGEFFRSSDPRARAEPGTGLGLAIVRRIVERHGGRIDLESTLGAGATFRVRLPRVAR
jgi:signal transduction histidine kinase